MRRILASLIAASALVLSTAQSGTAAPLQQWERWLHVPGVFDMAGPRSDGLLVVAAHTRLLLMSVSGVRGSYAPAYNAPDGSESYIALSPGLVPDGAACSFVRDDVYALDLRTNPPGITRVRADGDVSHLATVSGVSTLSGVGFDTVGDFGHRLLVIGPSGQGGTRVFAVDCQGVVTPVGTVGTALEGGIAVAPRTFGRYGGQLVAANEGNGSIYAVSSRGTLSTVVASRVPAGGDIGVESVGFVPSIGAAAAYVADRATPGNPHPGTDSILRMNMAALDAAGAMPGDALVATEGADAVVDVRCAATCTSTLVAGGPPTAHGEGRLLILPASGAAAPTVGATRAGARPWLVPLIGAVVLLSAAGALTVLARRRRG